MPFMTTSQARGGDTSAAEHDVSSMWIYNERIILTIIKEKYYKLN